MKAQNLRATLLRIQKHISVAIFMAAVILLTGAAATENASALYILTGVEDSAIVLDGSQEIPDLTDQIIHVSSSSRGYDIALKKGQHVVIHHGDEVLTTEAKNSEKISSLLKRLNVKLSPLEMVAVDVSDTDVALTISEEITYYDRVTEVAPFATVRVPNPDLLLGTEQVVQKGVDGEQTSIYEVVWSNGQLLSRQHVEKIETSAIDEVVEYGTSTDEVSRSDRISNVIRNEDGSGILEFESGVTLNFVGAKSMTATAYTAGYDGADYTTATGTFVKVGVVAVDKKVIPLGTRMYIVTDDGIVYGMARAEDTGVRGDVIDLYHDTYEQCINFGRRSCTVYIVEYPS